MKKILTLTLALMTLTVGCEKESGNTSGPSDELEPLTTAVSEPPSESESEPPTENGSEPHSDKPSHFGSVLDNSGVLTPDTIRRISSAADFITSSYQVNCAVAVTDDLGGKSPSEYAENCYKKMCGSSNGLMLLINNDTGNDYILRKGSPSKFITSADAEMLLTELSPLLVTEKYTEAVERTVDLFAKKLPEFTVDRTNTFDKEEIEEINEKLSSANSGGVCMSVIFIGDIGSRKIDDYAKEQFSKYKPATSGSACLMVLNINTAEYYICADDSRSVKEQGSLKDDIKGCLTEKDGKKSFNAAAAADIFIDFVK